MTHMKGCFFCHVGEWSVMIKTEGKVWGKTIIVIRLYKFGNVEQALQGAVLRIFLTLSVNIIVHSDLNCNCRDLTCLLREGVISHRCWCNKVFLKWCVVSPFSFHNKAIIPKILTLTQSDGPSCNSEQDATVDVLGHWPIIWWNVNIVMRLLRCKMQVSV